MAVEAIILFFNGKQVIVFNTFLCVENAVYSGNCISFSGSGAMIPAIAIKGLFLLLMLLTFVVIAWFVILTTQENCIIRNRLKAVPSSK